MQPLRQVVLGGAAGLSLGLVGSIAYATIPAATGQVTACYGTDGFRGQHIVTLLATAASAKCQPGQTLIQWSQTGPQGAPGVPGLNGTNGANGTNGTNGTNGVSGYEVVSAFGSPGGGPVTAQCPPGKRVLGGGAGSTRPLEFSFPTNNNTAWVVGIIDSPPGGSASAFAICANVA